MLGPLFRLEMVSNARATRTYVVRSLYGATVFLVAASAYRQSFFASGHVQFSGDELTAFARRIFDALVIIQGVAAILLAPAMTAGAVAGEAQAKTLDELLTTELTASEVVADKASARLALVMTTIFAGFPLLMLTAEIGGLGPWAALAALGVTLSTAFFLAGLALIASTQSRSVRGALNATMTIGLSWLIVPGAVQVLLPRSGITGYSLSLWVEPINTWVAASSPFVAWMAIARGSVRSPEELGSLLGWMVGLQLVMGAIWVGLAAALLRPGARLRSGGYHPRGAPGESRRTLRPCTDDPMLWKEIDVPRLPALYRPAGMLIGLVLGILMIWSTLGYATVAFREVLASGYGVAPVGSARAVFLVYLRVVVTGIAVVYLLGVASDAAAGLTSERERDTWVSLITTPLTGREIVRAKVLGALWGIRHTAVVFVGLVFSGVVAGSVHPLGMIAVFAEFAAFTAMGSTMGTWVSLRARSTTQALAITILMLAAINASGLLLGMVPGVGQLGWSLCTPLSVASSLASFGDLSGVLSYGMLGVITDERLARTWVRSREEMATMCVVGLFTNLTLAWLFYRTACQGFDAVLDRPHIAETNAVTASRQDLQSPKIKQSASTRRPILVKPRQAKLNS